MKYGYRDFMLFLNFFRNQIGAQLLIKNLEFFGITSLAVKLNISNYNTVKSSYIALVMNKYYQGLEVQDNRYFRMMK